MKFDANKTPIEIIKEGAFGDTYFRDICSGFNGKWYRKSWKKFDQLKDIDKNYYFSNYYYYYYYFLFIYLFIYLVLNAEHR